MSQHRIFIDAGHGGSDSGAVGNGMREADIVLDIARFLGNILEAAGISVRFSRTTDTNVSINDRWQAANAWNATLFVSVHANAGGGTGVETLIPTASPNNTNRDLQANRRLAEIISNTLGNTFNMRVRRANGVMLETETRHGSVGVLRWTRMLAVLPEVGFVDSPLSNPDVEILRNRRQEIAQALANGIFEFLGINPTVQIPIPADVAPWAVEAWRWGMTNGITDGTRPTANVTRQEMVTMLERLHNLLTR